VPEEAKIEFITQIDFGNEDRLSPKQMLAYEKVKYKKGILPKIKELEKELKSKGFKEDELSKNYTQELFKQNYKAGS
jgi:hypothetical protein